MKSSALAVKSKTGCKEDLLQDGKFRGDDLYNEVWLVDPYEER